MSRIEFDLDKAILYIKDETYFSHDAIQELVNFLEEKLEDIEELNNYGDAAEILINLKDVNKVPKLIKEFNETYICEEEKEESKDVEFELETTLSISGYDEKLQDLYKILEDKLDSCDLEEDQGDTIYIKIKTDEIEKAKTIIKNFNKENK